MKDASWFEMKSERKPRFATASWVPLYRRWKSGEGTFPTSEYWEDTIVSWSAIFPDSEADLNQRVSWSDIRRINGNRPEVSEEEYTPAREFWTHHVESTGEYLVFEHQVGDGITILIEPDLICALRLEQDGLDWVYPDEGHTQVIRQHIDSAGHVTSIEIRSTFLKDYLCARHCQLVVATYREREQVVPNLPEFGFDREYKSKSCGFEYRVLEIDDAGGMHGTETAVIMSGYSDIDEDDDVPVFQFGDAEQTWSSRHSFRRGGTKRFRLISDLWLVETVQPSRRSPIVRGDEVEPRIEFVIDNDDNRLIAADLIKPPSRWLWFSPKLITAVLGFRKTQLEWYTCETGGIQVPGWGSVVFGVNDSDLINIYAKDVGQLSEWWQRVFVSHNLAPEGKVCRELLASQMECKPAESLAPEIVLRIAIDQLNATFRTRTGIALFRDHDAETDIWSGIHRFASTTEPELYQLSKNLTRVCIERLDFDTLKKLTPAMDKKTASIKRLGGVLEMAGGDGRKLTRVLVGVNELRQRDSHLPSVTDLDDSFRLAGIDRSLSYVRQGKTLIQNLAVCLLDVEEILVSQGGENLPQVTN